MKPYDELSEREKLILIIWDACKDAYGVRPRNIDFTSMKVAELEKLYSKICEDIS